MGTSVPDAHCLLGLGDIHIERRHVTWPFPPFPNPKHKAPPHRKPLTDEEIILIVAECAASHQHTDIHFARAIERAHGIKELV